MSVGSFQYQQRRQRRVWGAEGKSREEGLAPVLPMTMRTSAIEWEISGFPNVAIHEQERLDILFSPSRWGP
jgi:hypothetical protein